MALTAIPVIFVRVCHAEICCVSLGRPAGSVNTLVDFFTRIGTRVYIDANTDVSRVFLNLLKKAKA